MVDRYTYYVLQFLEGVKPNSQATIDELVSLMFLFPRQLIITVLMKCYALFLFLISVSVHHTQVGSFYSQYKNRLISKADPGGILV